MNTPTETDYLTDMKKQYAEHVSVEPDDETKKMAKDLGIDLEDAMSAIKNSIGE